ncbi:transporter [Fusobacterium simiae]|uniref:Transporter n=1 Tax=Fusobacterium simiae TaxID=855 RepID=A0ABT4DK32_FUSSI|nr:transporter [Fusobacterium simiae]MCY7007741.1 transporter [Fusobacterium simiae]
MLKELKENKKLIFILILFLILPFFRFPDLRNEMKYLDIIQEMMDKKNYWILYYQGRLYPDKPPLYFWLLISAYKIFGENLVFPLSLIFFSYLPFLGILFLGYWQLGYLKKEWRSNFLIYSLTIPYLMGISIFLRMDMLMTFFITLVLSLFIHFYFNQDKINNIKLFLFYLSIFLGAFTKGPLGVIFPILIIFIFLYLENNLKFLNLLHWKTGIIFLLVCFSLWFLILYQQPDGKEYIYLLLNKQTVGRAYKSFSHARPFYYYFVYIPLTFFPYGLFYIYGFFKYLKNWKKKKEWTLFEKWTFSWSIPSLILLSIVSGKLQIYMLPIYIGMIFLSLIIRDKLIEKYPIIKNIEKYTQNFIIILYVFLPVGLFIYANYFKS